MPVPVEQTCPKCRARFVGSDMVGLPCPACDGLTPALESLDYSAIETRVIGWLMQFILDKFGTERKARSALTRALSAERRFNDMTVEEKDAFIEWMLYNAEAYEDGDTVDWIGGFYDYIEN